MPASESAFEPASKAPSESAPYVEPAGFLVLADETTRIHFLDWGAPEGRQHVSPAVLLLHGIAASAWVWAPIGRRLAGAMRVIAPDLRGHGLSDAPTAGYNLAELAGDALAVLDGCELPAGGPSGIVVAGHGFGAIVAAQLAGELGERCRRLVLVDGGWEDLGDTGIDSSELLAALEEPPEVLRSMAAYLADRAAFDPATWNPDQERAARSAVVELPVGRVVPVARPHVLAACVRAMLAYRPSEVLARVSAPIVAMIASGDRPTEQASSARAALEAARSEAPGRPLEIIDVAAGHNLMRYRPDLVAAAILGAETSRPAYHQPR